MGSTIILRTIEFFSEVGLETAVDEIEEIDEGAVVKFDIVE